MMPESIRRIAPLLLLLLIASACDGGAAEEVAPGGEVISLQGIGYSTGSDAAPVVVVEFSDFGCPYCARFALDSYPEIHAEFVLSGRVRWVYAPFVLGIFPGGEGAAMAGECAGEQGRFWQMHDLLYEHQSEWKSPSGPREAVFRTLAERARVDLEVFDRCMREEIPAERIAHANRTAGRIGIRATPTFIINGQILEGALTPEQFGMVIEAVERMPR